MSLIEIVNFLILLVGGFLLGQYLYANYGFWFGVLDFFGGIIGSFLVLNGMAYFLNIVKKKH